MLNAILASQKRSTLILCLLISSIACNAQVFWTEDFGSGCSQGNLASGYSGTNGTWTVTYTGTNDTYANIWYVSATEAGMGAGNCGDGCGNNASLTNRTLHLGPSPLLGGDAGATYNAGGICGLGICVATESRVESPVINCSGHDTITLSFNYFMQGSAGLDFAALAYYDGTSWSYYNGIMWTATFTSLAPSNNISCAGQGHWTAYSAPLPASANNNPNVKIGFRWTNNDDGVGTDPSFAVDDITISGTTAPSCSVSISVTQPILCNGDCTGELIANPTGAFPFTFFWNTGMPNPTNTNLCAGVYVVTMTDINLCTATASISLVEPTAIAFGNLINTNPSCIGCSNGTICQGPLSGGTPAYTLTISPTATFNGNCFLNLGADDYVVCVTDMNGCSVCQDDTLADPPTGFEDNYRASEINIYPNPFSSKATLEVYGLPFSVYSLIIHDALGKEVSKSEIRNLKYEMQRGDLQDGIYFFDLLSEEKQVIWRGKFVLQ